RYHDAELSLLAALRIQESAYVLSNLGAFFYAQERYDEALGYFERCLALGPTYIRYANLGDAYRQLGREDQAAAAYRKGMALAETAVAHDPRDALSRVFLGMLAAQLRDPHRAETELLQSVALDHENAFVIRQAAI